MGQHVSVFQKEPEPEPTWKCYHEAPQHEGGKPMECSAMNPMSEVWCRICKQKKSSKWEEKAKSEWKKGLSLSGCFGKRKDVSRVLDGDREIVRKGEI